MRVSTIFPILISLFCICNARENYTLEISTKSIDGLRRLKGGMYSKATKGMMSERLMQERRHFYYFIDDRTRNTVETARGFSFAVDLYERGSLEVRLGTVPCIKSELLMIFYVVSSRLARRNLAGSSRLHGLSVW